MTLTVLFCDASCTQFEPGFLRAMIQWRGDEHVGGLLSQLKGRALLAKMDDMSLGLVLVRYELDKSSAFSALCGKHVMVVEATALSPNLRPDGVERPIVEGGLQ